MERRNVGTLYLVIGGLCGLLGSAVAWLLTRAPTAAAELGLGLAAVFAMLAMTEFAGPE